MKLGEEPDCQQAQRKRDMKMMDTRNVSLEAHLEKE